MHRYNNLFVNPFTSFVIADYNCVLTIHYNADQIHVNTYEPEVNQFSSCIGFCNLFVNPFLLCPDNTLQCRPNPCQSTYEPEILHVNRFSSKLVHNLFVNPFLLCPDNTLQCRPNPCQNTYEPEILQVNRFSSELVHRYIINSLTLLLHGEATHLP